MENCPCQSGNAFNACCGPYLAGKANPETAEAMMRARYTAHVKVDIDFVEKTHHPETVSTFDAQTAKDWAMQSNWLGLEILETQAGQAEDDKGTVEFVARFRDKSGRHKHHELSEFEKVDGKWYFKDATVPKPRQVVREAPKVGRNDPCPCGSGKKSKKCCGKAA